MYPNLIYQKIYNLKKNPSSYVSVNEYINTFSVLENVYFGRQGQDETRTRVDSQGMRMVLPPTVWKLMGWFTWYSKMLVNILISFYKTLYKK